MIAEAGLIIAGILIGTTVMTVGIGGGILWVPLLILGYGHTAPEAITTSFLIQIAGQGSGAIAYLKSGLVEKKLVVIISLTALPSVILGSLLTVNLPDTTVQMALGIMAIILAIRFVVANEVYKRKDNYSYDPQKVKRILPLPAFFGLLMGFLSLGISEWLIPTLRNKLQLPMNRAIATMVTVMFVLAIAASLTHWSTSQSVRLDHFMWATLGVIFGGQIGARLAKYINERILKETFIYLMTLIGIHLVFQSV